MINSELDLKTTLQEIINDIPIIDMHTHLFSGNFGKLYKYGIDELLTYHHLVAEYFINEREILPSEFYRYDIKRRADLVWKKLFIENSPISESTHGVITILHKLGLIPVPREIEEIRKFFDSRNREDHLNKIFKIANIDYVVMTNDPFDMQEREYWQKGGNIDNRFKTAMRIDQFLLNFTRTIDVFKSEGYYIDDALHEDNISLIRKFFDNWIKIMNPLYIMCSLPPDFNYPDNNTVTKLIDKIVLPIASEYNLPFAMMLGVKREINPILQTAGDGIGKSNIEPLINLASNNPNVKFLATFLSRENIYESAVIARKFNNIKLFGCWWYTSTPFLIEEILNLRIDLLGTGFIAQHSDARINEQLIYKWIHIKKILVNILAEKYSPLYRSGWKVTENTIKRDLEKLLHKNFTDYIS